ncbi:hypothetical protein [Mesorhizobium sp. WSM1497]|uniref:ATP dependent DNA ligase n=2 Tax=unclassified Mesorhizobium TaxID=325217 RepID=UPI0007ED1C7A
MASLILGTYEKGKLVYRGRVGTGFTQASCRRRSCWPAIYRLGWLAGRATARTVSLGTKRRDGGRRRVVIPETVDPYGQDDWSCGSR